MGRDSGWKPQRRDARRHHVGAMPGTIHKRHMLLSCVTAVIVWFLSPPLLAWLSPALLGLFLAVPLSRASGSESLGRLLSRVALLRTPEEVDTPPLVARRRDLVREAGSAAGGRAAPPGARSRVRASRTSTAIWRGPRIRAAIRTLTPSPRNRN